MKKAVYFCPAFVAAIGYIDSDNDARNIQAGAEYGNMRLWVIVWASLIAVLVKVLSSKLGLATGSSLAEMLRRHLPASGENSFYLAADILGATLWC